MYNKSNDKDLVFFNPDILVNRLDLLIRLIREADKTERDELRNFLVTASALTIEAIRQGIEVDHTDEILH
jgi:tRNA G26 N,N-dimethylase Trm1